MVLTAGLFVAARVHTVRHKFVGGVGARLLILRRALKKKSLVHRCMDPWYVIHHSRRPPRFEEACLHWCPYLAKPLRLGASFLHLKLSL